MVFTPNFIEQKFRKFLRDSVTRAFIGLGSNFTTFPK